MSELTAKQKAFIEAVPVNQWNGTKAALAAGYSKKNAGVMAHRLLKNPKIAKELEKRMAEIAEKTDVEIADVVTALRQIAFGGKKATNFGDFVLSTCLDKICTRQEISGDNQRHKNGQDTRRTAILADNPIAPRGFEPLLPG